MAVVSAASSCGGLLSTSGIRADPAGVAGCSHVGLRRAPVSLSLRPAVVYRNGVYTYQGQRWRVSCSEATWQGKDFQNQAGRVAEEARRRATDAAKAFSSKAEELLNNAKRKASEFSAQNDLGGRVNRAARTANRKFEEFGYETKRTAAKWDRQFRISKKVQEAREFAIEQIQNADRQLGVRQKARNFSSDLRLKWPKYRRQLANFLETPIGKSFVGVCPNCGQRYVGGRNQSVTCSRCRGVVWQPRQDFSKDKSDPRIIDIDIDPQ